MELGSYNNLAQHGKCQTFFSQNHSTLVHRIVAHYSTLIHINDVYHTYFNLIFEYGLLLGPNQLEHAFFGPRYSYAEVFCIWSQRCRGAGAEFFLAGAGADLKFDLEPIFWVGSGPFF